MLRNGYDTIKEVKEQEVYMGEVPLMTTKGSFIINGTERVIVTQLVRSPGAYLMEPKDPTKQVFTANLMPSRGSWLELEIDKKGIVYARIDRKRKLPITTLLRALPRPVGRHAPPRSWATRARALAARLAPCSDRARPRLPAARARPRLRSH